MTEQYQQNNININPRGARRVFATTVNVTTGEIEIDFDDELVIIDTNGASSPFPLVRLPDANQIPGFTLTLTLTLPITGGVRIIPQAGQTIGGGASISLTEANQIVSLQAGDGENNWEVVSSGSSTAAAGSGLIAGGTAVATGGPLDVTPQGTVSLTGLRFNSANIALIGNITSATPALGDVAGDATQFNINASGVYQITFNLGGSSASSILAGSIVKNDSGTLPPIALPPESGFSPTAFDILNIGINRNAAVTGDSICISTTLVVSDSGTAPSTFSAPVGVALGFSCTSLADGFTPADNLTKITFARIADA